MDFAQLPIVQGGAVAVLLAVVWLIYTGRLVPRSTLDDVRTDRDARVREANEDADAWRRLWESEHEAHDLTRRAYAEEMRAVLLASTEGTQIGVTLLKEIKAAAAQSEAP